MVLRVSVSGFLLRTLDAWLQVVAPVVVVVAALAVFFVWLTFFMFDACALTKDH